MRLANAATPINFSNGNRTAAPLTATTGTIRPNTPIGASRMIHAVTLYITSARPVKKRSTTCAFWPTARMPQPKSSAKKIICSMLPSASALIGFVGMIPSSTDAIEGASFTFTLSSPVGSTKPAPTLNALASTRPSVTAKPVVSM